VANVVNMFTNCVNITEVNIGRGAINMVNTFAYCNNLHTVRIYSAEVNAFNNMIYYRNNRKQLNIFVKAGSNTNKKLYSSGSCYLNRYQNYWSLDNANNCYKCVNFNVYVYYNLED